MGIILQFNGNKTFGMNTNPFVINLKGILPVETFIPWDLLTWKHLTLQVYKTTTT